MENERELFDEVYERALEQLDDLTPGSEEYERQAKAISDMLKARAEQMRAEADVNNRSSQNYINLAQVAVGVISAGVTLFGILMQRKTNKDVMSFEEDDVITSRAFDNKTKFR